MGIDVLLYKAERIDDGNLFCSNKWNSRFYNVIRDTNWIEKTTYWYATKVISIHDLPYIKAEFLKEEYLSENRPYKCSRQAYIKGVKEIIDHLKKAIEDNGGLIVVDFG